VREEEEKRRQRKIGLLRCQREGAKRTSTERRRFQAFPHLAYLLKGRRKVDLGSSDHRRVQLLQININTGIGQCIDSDNTKSTRGRKKFDYTDKHWDRTDLNLFVYA